MEKIVISSIIAIILMTGFSYAISGISGRMFKEPVLLVRVLNSLNKHFSENTKWLIACLIHYTIGLFFILFYHYFWEQGLIKVNVIDTFIYGISIAVIGAVGWAVIFKLCQCKPKDLNWSRGYYFQLIIAHLIFVFAVYKVLA